MSRFHSDSLSSSVPFPIYSYSLYTQQESKIMIGTYWRKWMTSEREARPDYQKCQNTVSTENIILHTHWRMTKELMLWIHHSHLVRLKSLEYHISYLCDNDTHRAYEYHQIWWIKSSKNQPRYKWSIINSIHGFAFIGTMSMEKRDKDNKLSANAR